MRTVVYTNKDMHFWFYWDFFHFESIFFDSFKIYLLFFSFMSHLRGTLFGTLLSFPFVFFLFDFSFGSIFFFFFFFFFFFVCFEKVLKPKLLLFQNLQP